jgi:hypothetical protein
MPPRQPKPGEPLTFGDRAVTALLGGICAFGTMLLVWFVVMYGAGRSGQGGEMPFSVVWLVSGVAAGLAFVAGPDRMLDAFGRVWGLFGWLFGMPPRSDLPTRRRQR